MRDPPAQYGVETRPSVLGTLTGGSWLVLRDSDRDPAAAPPRQERSRTPEAPSTLEHGPRGQLLGLPHRARPLHHGRASLRV